jgi:hypothetical protein
MSFHIKKPIAVDAAPAWGGAARFLVTIPLLGLARFRSHTKGHDRFARRGDCNLWAWAVPALFSSLAISVCATGVRETSFDLTKRKCANALSVSVCVIPRLVFHRRLEDLGFAQFIKAEQNGARRARGMAGAINRVING